MDSNIPLFDFSSLELWKKMNVIGRGGSSTVYKVQSTIHSNTIVAMKEIQIDGLTKEQILAIEVEIETMKSLNHANIVNYLGTFRQQSNFYIFLEFAEKGSLRQFYQKNGRLTEAQASSCTKSMLLGLLYLHSNGIAHRDIKGANVLLAEHGEMKLADFGASKRLDTASIVSGLKGTPHWMAPEVIKGTQMSTGWMKADVWSLGCTVVEMVTGALPFSEYSNPMTAMYHIANGKSPPIAEDIIISKEAREFVSLCCSVEPNDRPTVEILLQHPFILNQTTEAFLFPLISNDLSNTQQLQQQQSSNTNSINNTNTNTTNTSNINNPSDLSSSSSEETTRLCEHNTSNEVNEKSEKKHLTEGQMVLQKLNRCIALDVNASSKSSSPLSFSEDALTLQNQVTPVIHQTRKKRNQESPVSMTVNTNLGNTTNSRNVQLLPPTGKKAEKKTSSKSSSPPTLKLDPTSPSSIIRGAGSGEDTDRSSEYHRTSRSNSTSSNVCATPIMMHDGSNHDHYPPHSQSHSQSHTHIHNYGGIASCGSPPIIVSSTENLSSDDKSTMDDSIPIKNPSSAFEPHRTGSGRFECPIPVTLCSDDDTNSLISPGPSLSRSISMEDSMLDDKIPDLRPIAPLSGEKINICCEGDQPTIIVVPEPKESKLIENKETKLSKKQPLKSINRDSKSGRSPLKYINKSHHNDNKTSNHNTHNIRSKSASTVMNSPHNKIILPPMQTLHESSSNFSLLTAPKKSNVIPELPLRLVQSAPSLSQSINLPPLPTSTLPTITSSSLSTSSSSPVILHPNNIKSHHQSHHHQQQSQSLHHQQHQHQQHNSISNKLSLKLSSSNLSTSSSTSKLITSHHQKRPSFEAYEQEGGILAPRR